MHKNTCRYGRFLRCGCRNRQNAWQAFSLCANFHRLGDGGWEQVVFLGLHGRFSFGWHKVNRHHFPVIFLVLMGEIHVQVHFFHAQMQNMCLGFVFGFREAGITAQAHKITRHKF